MTISERSPHTVALDSPKARRAAVLFESAIRPRLSDSPGRYLVLDLTSGDFETGNDDIAAEERLLARLPTADLYVMSTDGGPSGQITWR
jgi:hypothetical protein